MQSPKHTALAGIRRYGTVFFSDSDHSTRGTTTLPGTMEPVKALPYRSLFDLDFQSSPWGSRPILQMSNELRSEITH